MRTIAATGSAVYAGGDFPQAGGSERARLAAFHPVSGATLSWDPAANNTVHTVVVGRASGSPPAARCARVGGVKRRGVVALDAATGQPTSFDAGLNGDGYEIAHQGSTLYVGGLFTQVGGQPMQNLAALDAATGAARPVFANVQANGAVNTLAISANRLFIGGAFTSLGSNPSAPADRLASLDPTTGAVDATWLPAGASNPVHALDLDQGTLYAGGEFTTLGGAAAQRAWGGHRSDRRGHRMEPGADNVVRAIVADAGTVFVSGSFLNVGTQPRARIAALKRRAPAQRR